MRIKKFLKQEVEKDIPNISKQIMEEIDWEEVKLNNAVTLETENKNTDKIYSAKQNKFGFGFKLATAFCAIAILCLGIILPITQNPSGTPTYNDGGVSYYVTFSVENPSAFNSTNQTSRDKVSNNHAYSCVSELRGNALGQEINILSESGGCPKVQFEVDKNDFILSQKGLNEDGYILLFKENFKQKNINNVTETLIKKLNNTGCLNGIVKMCVRDKKGNENTKKQQEVFKVIERVSQLVNVTFENFKELDEEAFEKIETEFENFESKIEEFKVRVENDFTAKLNKAIEDEKNEINNLIDNIRTIRGEREDETSIGQDGDAGVTELKKLIISFNEKYNFELDAEEINELTFKKLRELEDELVEDLEDLQEHEQEIKEWQDDSDDVNLKDVVEGLYEIVKEGLFQRLQ